MLVQHSHANMRSWMCLSPLRNPILQTKQRPWRLPVPGTSTTKRWVSLTCTCDSTPCCCLIPITQRPWYQLLRPAAHLQGEVHELLLRGAPHHHKAPRLRPAMRGCPICALQQSLNHRPASGHELVLGWQDGSPGSLHQHISPRRMPHTQHWYALSKSSFFK